MFERYEFLVNTSHLQLKIERDRNIISSSKYDKNMTINRLRPPYRESLAFCDMSAIVSQMNNSTFDFKTTEMQEKIKNNI